MTEAFDASLREQNRSRAGELPLLEGTTVVWATYDIAAVTRDPARPGRLVLDYIDPHEGAAEQAELRSMYLGTTRAPRAGVYVWYVLRLDHLGAPSVHVAYVGQSGRLLTRISRHASGRRVWRGRRPPLAAALDQYLDPADGQHEVRLGLVRDVVVHGRNWRPEREDERLLVEAAMVVHGTTVRAHGMMNAAAGDRTLRA